MMPDKDQWGAWKTHPCSEWFFAAIERDFKRVTESFVMGETVNLGSVDETALATVSVHAQSKLLYVLGQANYEDIAEMLDIVLDDGEEDDGENSTEGYASVSE